MDAAAIWLVDHTRAATWPCEYDLRFSSILCALTADFRRLVLASYRPDQSTFIMEDTWFGDGVQLEANHHCMVGVTGVLCFPQYVFHNVIWKSTAAARWMWFQGASTNYGGVFTLSPPNAQVVMGGGVLEDSVFPPGFVSLVSHHYTYLLSLPGNLCILSTAYGTRYDGGILCTVPLRSLKVSDTSTALLTTSTSSQSQLTSLNIS